MPVLQSALQSSCSATQSASSSCVWAWRMHAWKTRRQFPLQVTNTPCSTVSTSGSPVWHPNSDTTVYANSKQAMAAACPDVNWE